MDYPNCTSVEVDFDDLDQESSFLSSALLGLNTDCGAINILNAASDAMKLIVPPDLDQPELVLKIVNLPQQNQIAISSINQNHLGKFITVSGQVTEQGKTHYAFETIAYMCARCGYTNFVEQEHIFKEREPFACEGCEKSSNQTSFSQLPEYSKGYVRRFITIQENPEDANIRGGEPGSIDIMLNGVDLVNKFSLGSRCKFNGILKQTKELSNDKLRTFYLECNSIETDDDARLLEPTEEERNEFKKMAQRTNVLDALASKMATSIHGYTIEKKIILLQIVGGVPEVIEDDGSKVRGDIHILFVGDPGTAKSQLLRYAARIAPRAEFVSAPRSTKAGLIGSYAMGKHGFHVYRAGALTRADKGFCVIDEFEKMSPEDSQGMHEAMEQQHTTITMAYGMVEVITRCPILAAANPEKQRFNPESPIKDQIPLEPAMFSRFDLVLPFIDNQSPTKDRAIAHHILNHDGIDSDDGSLSNIMYIQKYISMAKQYSPKLTKKAIERLTEFYVQKRSFSTKFSLTMTARNIDGLKRLTCASAKIRFSEVADKRDADLACDLMEYFLTQMHEDIGSIIGGTKKEMIKEGKLHLFRSVISELNGGFSEEELMVKAKSFGLEDIEVRQLIMRGLDRGELYHSTANIIKPRWGGGSVA